MEQSQPAIRAAPSQLQNDDEPAKARDGSRSLSRRVNSLARPGPASGLPRELPAPLPLYQEVPEEATAPRVDQVKTDPKTCLLPAPSHIRAGPASSPSGRVPDPDELLASLDRGEYPIIAREGKVVFDGEEPLDPQLHGYPSGQLAFESRFESGNLSRATLVGLNEYDLMLRPDLNTSAHVQWYYFRVSNMKKRLLYTFNILNMMKKKSLYTSGLLPLVYSNKDAKERGVGWRRGGENVLLLSE